MKLRIRLSDKHKNVWPYCITFNRLLDKLLGSHPSVNMGVKLLKNRNLQAFTCGLVENILQKPLIALI